MKKYSKKNLIIIFSIIFVLTFLPSVVLAQDSSGNKAVILPIKPKPGDSNTDPRRSNYNGSDGVATDKTTTRPTNQTQIKISPVRQRLEEKRSELERLRQAKMKELQEQQEVKVMELNEKKEVKTQELKDKMDVRKSESVTKKQEMYTKRVESKKEFVLKHIERVRGLINKFMERVALMKESGKDVPASIEADFIVAFDTLTTIENKVNAINSTSSATTLDELKAEYRSAKTTFEGLQEDFKDVKSVLEGILSTLKFVNLSNSNSTQGGN